MFKFGTILKPVGLKGEVRVFSDSDFLNERLVKNQTFIANNQTLTVQYASIDNRVHKVKFKEINSIEEAIKFRQVNLMLSDLDETLLMDDEYFIVDLIGCDVIEDNKVIGQVIQVIDQPAHMLLQVKEDENTFLIPFVEAFVKEVDVKNKQIVVQLIEGMK